MLSHFSNFLLFATPWTVAHQAPLSMRFPREEYWIGLPFPSPGNLPNPGTEPCISCVSCITSRFFTTDPVIRSKSHSHRVIMWISWHQATAFPIALHCLMQFKLCLCVSSGSLPFRYVLTQSWMKSVLLISASSSPHFMWSTNYNGWVDM